MTYPPQPPGGGPYGPPQPGPYGQQPGPYGQQPGGFGGPGGPGGPYGQQPPPPDPYQQQPTYQGLGGYPGGPGEPPPKKSNTKVIIAVVVIAVLVLGGAGTAIYFLTKNKDNNASGGSSQQTSSQPSDSRPSDDPTSKANSGGADSPDQVQQAYIEAYQSKQFGSVVESACKAYKDKFGTNTTELEQQLAPYDIKATADGEPEVTGSTATAKIDLELTKGGETKKPKIKIKIVKESGSWKFCGEGEA
ncbi:MAG: hypothetical protein LC792_22385 [Actinobacteria bacterium]|nr:hypothetical protein [Actinomycetota bacterium]